MCIHMDLMSCLCNAHAKHGFRCSIKNFVIMLCWSNVENHHVLRNDTNCFKMSICKGRHRNASFLSVPLIDAISTEKSSKGKHWHQRKYDIETQDAYNLSGA